jgi:hypothetical protein
MKILSPKQPERKKTGGMVQDVEYLSSKCKALSANPSTAKKCYINAIYFPQYLFKHD